MSFAVKLEFAEHDVFWGSDHEFKALIPAQAAAARERPGMEWIGAYEVNVCFVAGLVVDEVKMAALMPGLLGSDYRFRRHVKFRLRKRVKQASSRGAVQGKHDVGGVGDTGCP